MTASRAPRSVLRPAVAAFLALVTLLAVMAVGAPPAAAGTAEEEAELHQLQNQARREHGLAALADDHAADAVARSWAQELARSGDLRHNPNLAAHVDAYVTREWRRIGENVGYSGTIDQVFRAYMNSTGHRHNILGDYNRVGIGAVRDRNGRLWTTIVFVKGPAISTPAPRCHPPAADETATSNSVSRLYRAYFLRDADEGGRNYWVPKYRSGEMCLSDISDYFAQSNEFRSRYGSLDVPEFVRLVYVNVLGREPDPEGYEYWANRVRSGAMTRGGMMVGFSESAEFRSKTGLR